MLLPSVRCSSSLPLHVCYNCGISASRISSGDVGPEGGGGESVCASFFTPPPLEPSSLSLSPATFQASLSLSLSHPTHRTVFFAHEVGEEEERRDRRMSKSSSSNRHTTTTFRLRVSFATKMFFATLAPRLFRLSSCTNNSWRANTEEREASLGFANNNTDANIVVSLLPLQSRKGKIADSPSTL